MFTFRTFCNWCDLIARGSFIVATPITPFAIAGLVIYSFRTKFAVSRVALFYLFMAFCIILTCGMNTMTGQYDRMVKLYKEIIATPPENEDREDGHPTPPENVMPSPVQIEQPVGNEKDREVAVVFFPVGNAVYPIEPINDIPAVHNLNEEDSVRVSERISAAVRESMRATNSAAVAIGETVRAATALAATLNQPVGTALATANAFLVPVKIAAAAVSNAAAAATASFRESGSTRSLENPEPSCSFTIPPLHRTKKKISKDSGVPSSTSNSRIGSSANSFDEPDEDAVGEECTDSNGKDLPVD